MIIVESLGGRFRAVLRDRPGAVHVAIFDRGALYRARLPKPAGVLIREGTLKGVFSEIASSVLANIQALEDEHHNTLKKDT